MGEESIAWIQLVAEDQQHHVKLKTGSTPERCVNPDKNESLGSSLKETPKYGLRSGAARARSDYVLPRKYVLPDPVRFNVAHVDPSISLHY
jgi:hypothetical protein